MIFLLFMYLYNILIFGYLFLLDVFLSYSILHKRIPYYFLLINSHTGHTYTKVPATDAQPLGVSTMLIRTLGPFY